MSGYDQRKINVHKGYIGERLAHEYLEKQGYQVQSYMILVDVVANHLQAQGLLPDWLGAKKDDFIKMNEAFDKIYSGKEHRRRAARANANLVSQEIW